MPGPMSAPNGNRILTMKPRDPNQRNINTGKTAKKRGADFQKERNQSGKPQKKMSRARRQEQEN